MVTGSSNNLVSTQNSDIENSRINSINNTLTTKGNNNILRPNFSENLPSKGASPSLAELAETCNKIGKNIGGTNQSLSESLVAQTIILDDQKRLYQEQQGYLQQHTQGISGPLITSHLNFPRVASKVVTKSYCGNIGEIQSSVAIPTFKSTESVSHIMNTSVPNCNTASLQSQLASPSQTLQTRPIMVSGQPQAMLPISSSVSNTNPPIDFTSLQPPPIETTLMSFASSQNNQILQGDIICPFVYTCVMHTL